MEQEINFSSLFDRSGGRGEKLTLKNALTIDGLKVGFAGGLSPENVEEVIMAITVFACDYWIDVESGVRTDGKFDLVKVREFLEICELFI